MTPAKIVKLVKTAAVAAGYTAKGRIFFKRGGELTTIVSCNKLSHFDRVRVAVGVYPNALLAEDPKLKAEVNPLRIFADKFDAPFGKVFWELGAEKLGQPKFTALKVETACSELFEWLRTHLEDERKLKKALQKNEPWIEIAFLDGDAITDWAAGTFDPKNYRDWMR